MTSPQSPATCSELPTDLSRSDASQVVPERLRSVALSLSGFFATVRDMLACFLDRVRDGSTVELVDNAGLAPLAQERCQAKVREALAEYVRTLHVEPGHTVSLRYEVRMIECEKCGTFCCSRDECPKCGLVATPSPNVPMIAHLTSARRTAERQMRRAEARRKPSVFRAQREGNRG